MPFSNLQDMPDETRESVNAALEIEFANPLRGSWREVANRINTTFDVDFDGEFVRDVYRRRHRNKNKSAASILEQDGPVVFDDTTQVDELTSLRSQVANYKDVNKRLFSQLQSAKLRSEDLVEAAFQGSKDAMLSFGPATPTSKLYVPNTNANHSPEAALWHMTDWQGSKLTTSYNSEVMFERVMRFCRKAQGITEIQRADHPVNRCVICFGGDMGEGLFNFPTQPFEIDATIFGQFVTVSRLIVQVVQYALAMYDEVEVVAEWGNHGRIGSKRDNVPRADNFDRMIYEMSRQLLLGETRLKWQDCPEDIQRIEIGNYRSLLIHGDEIGRNGYASPMTIVNHVTKWLSGSYKWDFRDVYVGHYHNHAEWSLPNGLGSVFQTGSTESDNRYALVGMAASATPTQRLHFIDMKKGRVSAQYKIYLEEEEDF